MPTPSVHDPRGILAAEIASLGVVMFALAGVVLALVVLLLLLAIFRRRRDAHDLQPRLDQGRLAALGGTSFIVLGGLGLPLITLAPLLVVTLRTMAVMAAPPAPATVSIEVIAHQYWWELRYPDSGFTTANEIHVPVGEVVQLNLTSYDVIHSFWVPQLLGKHDLIPGREHAIWLRADQAGVYRGECAEMCGIQHARMFFLVVAEPAAEFQRWLDRQRQPAPQSADATVQRGAAVFAREGCINCHAMRIGGAQPVGRPLGPDLTHVGSRLSLGAGILDNTPDNMARWIADTQTLKPGNAMPSQPMDPESLRAVAQYLAALD